MTPTDTLWCDGTKKVLCDRCNVMMWWWPCNCVVMWLSKYCLIATTLTPACDTWPNFVALPMNLETKRDTCDTCCRNILCKNIHYSKFSFPLLLVCDMYFVTQRTRGKHSLLDGKLGEQIKLVSLFFKVYKVYVSVYFVKHWKHSGEETYKIKTLLY